jgi:TetR/AcrR family tetracycline transcriptional repressor
MLEENGELPHNRPVVRPSSPGRPKAAVPRGTLSQALILRTSLNLIDRDGLTGLTIRKLAGELGVSAMAIYRHYRNKAEIERELVDIVVGDNDVTNHSAADWREWIYVTYANMRAALCAHPGVMPLLDNASYQGSKAMAVMDRILAELRQAGLSAEQAATLFHMLMAHMLGSVVLMNADARRSIAAGRHEEPTPPPARKLSIERVSLSAFPNIAELAPHLASLSEAEQFRHSVMAIIAAVTR